jgi:hypothetical protein
MRILLSILLSLTLTSCFVFDKLLKLNVNIDKSILSEIDSVFLIDSSEFSNEGVNQLKVTNDILDYKLVTDESKVKIRLKLRNSSYITSNTIETSNSNDKIYISKHDYKYTFNVIKESKFQKYSILFFIVLIVLLSTKIPIALLIISPSSKIDFLKQYGGLNLIYLGIFIICLLIFLPGFIGFLYLFYFVVLVSDLFFLIKYYDDKGIARPIIAGLISNLLFLTIGQFIITFAIMIYK